MVIWWFSIEFPWIFSTCIVVSNCSNEICFNLTFLHSLIRFCITMLIRTSGDKENLGKSFCNFFSVSKECVKFIFICGLEITEKGRTLSWSWPLVCGNWFENFEGKELSGRCFANFVSEIFIVNGFTGIFGEYLGTRQY